jgi:hypothetical protein
MSGLPWIPLAVDFPDSRKSVALGVALQQDQAWAYIVKLWTWFAKNAPEGRIDGPDAVAVIEHAAGWKGSAGELVGAAVLPHIQLLDDTGKGFAIHDWADHCGAHVEKREADRLRMRRLRKKNRSRTSREPSAHVPGETDRDKETDMEREASPTDNRPSGGAGGGRLVGQEINPLLHKLRHELATTFGKPKPLGIGKDHGDVERCFSRWFLGVGYDETLAECRALAKSKRTEPSHLSWFVGWLDSVSDKELVPPPFSRPGAPL